MKYFIVTVFLVFVSIKSFSQLTKGSIINGKDTIMVDFELPINRAGEINYNKIQKKLKFIDNEGDKSVLKAKEVSELRLFYMNDTVRMIRQVDPIQVPCEMCSPQYILLKLIVDGELKLFKYFDSGSNGINTAVSIAAGYIPLKTFFGKESDFYYYYQKGDNKLFTPTTYFHAEKEMIEYFSECESLVEKIRTKEIEEAIEVTRFYNSNCGN